MQKLLVSLVLIASSCASATSNVDVAEVHDLDVSMAWDAINDNNWPLAEDIMGKAWVLEAASLPVDCQGCEGSFNFEEGDVVQEVSVLISELEHQHGADPDDEITFSIKAYYLPPGNNCINAPCDNTKKCWGLIHFMWEIDGPNDNSGLLESLIDDNDIVVEATFWRWLIGAASQPCVVDITTAELIAGMAGENAFTECGAVILRPFCGDLDSVAYRSHMVYDHSPGVRHIEYVEWSTKSLVCADCTDN